MTFWNFCILFPFLYCIYLPGNLWSNLQILALEFEQVLLYPLEFFLDTLNSGVAFFFYWKSAMILFDSSMFISESSYYSFLNGVSDTSCALNTPFSRSLHFVLYLFIIKLRSYKFCYYLQL